MMRKFTIAVLCIFMCISLFTGCSSKVNYNAVLYDNAVDWIREDFQVNNLVGSTQSPYPSERTLIVNNQDEFNEIFLPDIGELDVDFTSQRLVVYTFRAIYRKSFYLKSVTMENGRLKVIYQMEDLTPGTGSATNPYQRYFVLKLDKVDITAVEFEKS